MIILHHCEWSKIIERQSDCEWQFHVTRISLVYVYSDHLDCVDLFLRDMSFLTKMYYWELRKEKIRYSYLLGTTLELTVEDHGEGWRRRHAARQGRSERILRQVRTQGDSGKVCHFMLCHALFITIIKYSYWLSRKC